MKSKGGWLWATLLVLAAVAVGYGMLPAEWKPAWLTAALARSERALAHPYFNVGDLAITPGFLLKTILFFVLLGVLASLVRRLLQRRVLPLTGMDPGQQYALARVTGYLVFVVGVMVGLQSAGVNLNSLLVVGGAIGIGVGFGLQNIANNFISGLILLIERPIKVGDRIEVEGVYGDVIRIAARSTWVRTNDNVVIVVPNSELTSKRVINWTANDRLVRFTLPLGVSYGSDPERVRAVLTQVAEQHADVLSTPPPDIIFDGFGDSALKFELRVWTATKTHTPKALTSELYFAIFRAFREQGIEIPFPQRDLHLKSVHAPLTVSQSG